MVAQSLAPSGTENKSGKVSMEALAKMTGFPVEVIKEEIFKGNQPGQEVSLDDLRTAMLSYIDSTMMLVGDEK